MLTRYKGQPLPIRVTFTSDPLVPYGATYSDITEVRMNLKRDLDTDADDAYLQKTSLDSGVVIDEANHTFVMTLNNGDYANITKGDYFLTLNVLIPAHSDFIELEIQSRTVIITTDTNRA